MVVHGIDELRLDRLAVEQATVEHLRRSDCSCGIGHLEEHNAGRIGLWIGGEGARLE